jgi:hypothetical protein
MGCEPVTPATSKLISMLVEVIAPGLGTGTLAGSVPPPPPPITVSGVVVFKYTLSDAITDLKAGSGGKLVPYDEDIIL